MTLIERYRKNLNNNTGTFNPADYEGRAYENEHATQNVQMAVRREDTRHGGRSEVVIASNRSGTNREMISLSLSEARSLKAFLDRELRMKAR